MMRRPWLTLVGMIAALGTASLIVISCATVERTLVAPPEIPGATFVGNQVCYDCHTNIVRIFPASPHARVHLPNGKLAGGTGCESCHGAGSKHVQGGGGRGKFIVNPGKDPAACFQCHLEVHAAFRLPQHHPIPEGKMNCVQCHDPHGADIMKPAGGLAMARLNESCAPCHRDQSRQFVFEHESMREGCTVCHTPHGSVNAKMLIERDNNLCLKCHAQTPQAVSPSSPRGQLVIGKVDHTAFVSRGACWSASCHTAIHGSNVNPKMLY